MEESRAKQIVREARAAVYANQNAAIAEGQEVQNQLSDLNPYVEMYAKEFGEHARNPGWRMGLLVALSVESGAGQGARTDLSQNCEKTGKIGLAAFSRLAGLSVGGNTAKKYLTAWDLAAAAGHVPFSHDLAPGQGFAFDEEKHDQKLWDLYFKSPAGDKDPDPVKKVESFFKTISNFDLREINAESCGLTETHVDDIEEWFVAIRAFGQAGLDRLDELTAEGLWTVET